MAEGFEYQEVFYCFGISVLADNSLTEAVWQEHRDALMWEKEFHTISPHALCQVGNRGYHMDDRVWVNNMSAPKMCLEQLPDLPKAQAWYDQYQTVTVLGLGAQDMIKGVHGYEDVLSQRDFWEDKLIRITREMVDRKRQRARIYGRMEKFQLWLSRHKFLVYPLPALPASEIEACGKITVDQYNLVKRRQNRRFDLRGVQAKFRHEGIYLMSPNISYPTFVDGHLHGNNAKTYVQGIFDFVVEKFCARCVKPLLNKGEWQGHRSVFCSTLGLERDLMLWRIEANGIWERVIGHLSIFDIGNLRQVNLAFYRLCHWQLDGKCRGLDIEAERVKLRTPWD